MNAVQPKGDWLPHVWAPKLKTSQAAAGRQSECWLAIEEATRGKRPARARDGLDGSL